MIHGLFETFHTMNVKQQLEFSRLILIIIP